MSEFERLRRVIDSLDREIQPQSTQFGAFLPLGCTQEKRYFHETSRRVFQRENQRAKTPSINETYTENTTDRNDEVAK